MPLFGELNSIVEKISETRSVATAKSAKDRLSYDQLVSLVAEGTPIKGVAEGWELDAAPFTES